MALRRQTRRLVGYGLDNSLTSLAPTPIIANRVPTTSDTSPYGTLWIYPAGNAAYVLTSVANNSATWQEIESSGGAGSFSSLVVNPGPVTTTGTGAVSISGDAVATTVGLGNGAGAKTVTVGSTNTTSATTIQAGTGKVTISDNGNVAGAITLATAGGTSETILINNTLGTSTAAIRLTSSAGGVTLVSNGNIAGAISIGTNAGTSETLLINNVQGTSASSINISSTAGGVAVTAASTVTITGTTGIVLSGKLSLVAAGPQVLSGAGSPNGSVTAPQGSLYLNTTGNSSSTRAFINSDGATAWVAVTTAS